MNIKSEYLSPVGVLTIVVSDGALVGVWLHGQKYHGPTAAIPAGDNDVMRRVTRWLDEYFAGGRPKIDFKLAATGTAFQQRVWHALGQIPYGKTVTYGDVARRVGCGTPRAVGTAIGHNPISIIVPCHRVVGANGTLTGYAGGLRAKEILLGIEQGIIHAK